MALFGRVAKVFLVSTIMFLPWSQVSAVHVHPLLDPDLPVYSYPDDREPLSGKVVISGSDTMHPLVRSLVDGLKERHPNVKATISREGSKTGLEAILEHRSEIAAMSHRMTASELSEFVKEYGYEPTEVPIAVDALAIFVNKSNPITGLSLEELDAIFCHERRRGMPEPIDFWGMVGLEGEWFNAPIRLYGRNEQSGTTAFFREEICKSGPLSPRLTVEPGSASVILELESDRFGIGFSSIGYRASYVKPVPIASVKGGRYIEPTFENTLDGSYPLRRYLYLYVAIPPKSPPSPAIVELVRFALSRQGQKLALELGYYPLPSQEVSRILARWSKSVSAAQSSSPAEKPGS